MKSAPLLAASLAIARAHQGFAQEPLPSWNDTTPKKAIVEFAAKVTKEDGSEFVPPAVRIAFFDNEGTLWAEQPLYFQFFFAIDRVNPLKRCSSTDLRFQKVPKAGNHAG